MTLSLFSSSGNTSLLTPLFFQTLWRLSDKGVKAALAALYVQSSIVHALADYSEAPSKEIHSNDSRAPDNWIRDRWAPGPNRPFFHHQHIIGVSVSVHQHRRISSIRASAV